MDAGTRAVYQEAVRRYGDYLTGKPINVIDPDGSTPSKRKVRIRLEQLKQILAETES